VIVVVLYPRKIDVEGYVGDKHKLYFLNREISILQK